MLAKRLLTAVIALPVFAGALIFLPQTLWAIFLLPWIGIGAWEWGGLAAYRRLTRIAYVAFIVASAAALFYVVPLFASVPTLVDVCIYVSSAVFWFIVAPLWLGTLWESRNAFVLGGAGWLALVPMWLALAHLQATPWLLLLVLSIVWVADTAAYGAGKTMGRNKLAPRVSPGKTWEGAMGAAAAVAIYYGMLLVFVPPDDRYFDGLSGLAVFIAILALSVEGDLFESWMKRQAGVKDSGHIFPGHGGVLDRIDGLTSSVPVAALAYYLGLSGV
jgi:phosphatidate cytidylyltransferase